LQEIDYIDHGWLFSIRISIKESLLENDTMEHALHFSVREIDYVDQPLLFSIRFSMIEILIEIDYVDHHLYVYVLLSSRFLSVRFNYMHLFI
jgi:hypothetical protein